MRPVQGRPRRLFLHASLNAFCLLLHASLNESSADDPLGSDAVGHGLLAAFSGSLSGSLSGYRGKVRYNLGEAPFRNAPPAADFQAYVAFQG